MEQRALARSLISDQSDFHEMPFQATGFFRTGRDFHQRMFYRLGLDFVQGRPAETDVVEGVGHHGRQRREPVLAGPAASRTAGGRGELPLRLGGGRTSPCRAKSASNRR